MRRLPVLVAAFVVGCGSSTAVAPPPPAPPPPVPVASVSVSLVLGTVNVGQSALAIALVRDAGGNTLADRSVTWSSSNPTVGTLTPNGLTALLVSVAPGSTTIAAISEGVSGSAGLVVVPVPVAFINVSPPTGTVSVGSTLQLEATLKSATGVILTGRTILWSSSTPNLASISSAGLVTGLSRGGAVLQARADNGLLAFAFIDVRGWSLVVEPDPLGGFPRVSLSTDAEPEGTDGSTLGSGADLYLTCFGGANRFLSLFVSTGGPITASGSIRYKLDGAAAIATTWAEVPPSFNLLLYPADRNQAANLATTWASGQDLFFEYTQFQGPKRIAKFKLAGMAALLPQVLNACP